jgi:hypothetical protein
MKGKIKIIIIMINHTSTLKSQQLNQVGGLATHAGSQERTVVEGSLIGGKFVIVCNLIPWGSGITQNLSCP